MSQRTAFITGANGDIGRALCATFRGAGWKIVASDQGQWLQELTVSGVGGARDYRECLDYLQKLSVVERVSVKSASRGLVEFSLELNAAPMYLKEALASGRMLEYAEADSRWVLRK